MLENLGLYFIIGIFLLFVYFMLTAKKRREKYIRNYLFPSSLEKSFPQNITEGGKREVLEGLRTYFVILNQANNAKFFVPSKILLQTWRAFTKLDEYVDFSEKAFAVHIVPPVKSKKIKKNTLKNAFRTIWILARKEANISDVNSKELPLIFKLDKMYKIPNGTVYRFKKSKTGSRKKKKASTTSSSYNESEASWSITYDSDEYFEFTFEVGNMEFTYGSESDMDEYNDNVSEGNSSSSSSSSDSNSSSSSSSSSSDSGGGD